MKDMDLPVTYIYIHICNIIGDDDLGTQGAYDGSKPNRQMIKCRVPQGSILGPLIALFYIKDVCIVCKNTKPVIFAYDANLFSCGLDATGPQDGVSDELVIIQNGLK